MPGRRKTVVAQHEAAQAQLALENIPVSKSYTSNSKLKRLVAVWVEIDCNE